MTYSRLTAILLLLSCAAHATAQTMQTTRITREDTSFVTLVPLSSAECAAVGDAQGILALGRSEGTPDVVLYKVDDAGAPGEKPLLSFDLPRPESLPADRDNQPMFLLFHPKLPILYVWQDADRPKNDSAEYTPSYHALKHLLIYRLDGAAVKLEQGFDFGDKVQSGRTLGEMALDADAKRLYVGNLLDRRINRRSGDEVAVGGVGYLEIGGDGLVVMDGEEPKLTGVYTGTVPNGPNVGGFVPVSDDVVILAGTYGPLTWNLTDMRERFNSFFSWPPRYQKRIAGHPTKQVVYIACHAQAYIHCHEHVDGYPTLMPQVSAVSGPYNAPVVMTGQNGVAFGGDSVLTVYNLDDAGRFSGEFYTVRVNKRYVTAMAYSTKHNRLYVAEDEK